MIIFVKGAPVTNFFAMTVTNGYDLLNRLITQHLVGGADQTFDYTTRGLTNATDELGHLTQWVNDATGRTLFQTNANWPCPDLVDRRQVIV